jgi:hypothetical protein
MLDEKGWRDSVHGWAFEWPHPRTGSHSLASRIENLWKAKHVVRGRILRNLSTARVEEMFVRVLNGDPNDPVNEVLRETWWSYMDEFARWTKDAVRIHDQKEIDALVEAARNVIRVHDGVKP